ncbi:MAG: substrate-binding domain-containing protein [Asticcacaulis sp.]
MANSETHDALEFTVAGIDDLPDFNGDLTAPELVLYVGGNYFFAMPALVAAFEAEYADMKGRIYWETIPPGRLRQQLERQGRIRVGNMSWTVKADAYFAGLSGIEKAIKDGLVDGPAVSYATNDLTIMIRDEDRAKITSLEDLGRPGLRLAMPDPAYEGIAHQARAALVKTGGEALATTVYETKVSSGETLLTQIHHRQTPAFLKAGRVDAGVTWKSEALYQTEIGSGLTGVEIPDALNVTGTYAGAVVAGAAHPEAARNWLDFLCSGAAQDIFHRYGFSSCQNGRATAPAC